MRWVAKMAAYCAVGGFMAVVGLNEASSEPPQLRVMRGVPLGKGEWEVKIQSMKGEGLEEARRMMSSDGSMSMSICSDAVKELGKRPAMGPKRVKARDSDEDCRTKVLKNTRQVARLETQCGASMTRATIRRDAGKRRFRVQVSGTDDDGKRYQIKMSYAYKGKCSSDGPAVKSMKLNPEVCRQMKAQMSQLTSGQQCRALPAAQRTACEQQIKASLARFKAMCP